MSTAHKYVLTEVRNGVSTFRVATERDQVPAWVEVNALEDGCVREVHVYADHPDYDEEWKP